MKKKNIKLLIIIFMLVCIIGIVYSLFHIISWRKSINKNDDIKNKLEKTAIVFEEEEDNEYSIDFDYLKEMNSDTVGYLNVENTDVNYVVVKSVDNKYYLSHNFNKEYSVAGWIFADYKNKFDETDKNIVIYGHNMRDGSMFGSLKNIIKKNWYEEAINYKITLFTELGESNYQVFSIYTVRPEDYYITTSFTSNDDYLKFLNTIKDRSIYDYNVDLDINDSILTLSTCTTSGKERIVLHAKRINL